MKSFKDTFNPFDRQHLNEYFRSKATGSPPDFGVQAMGWLPADWLEQAEDSIYGAFLSLLERGQAAESQEEPVDISKLMWYDVNLLLKGAVQPEMTQLQEAYFKALGAALKLKQFLMAAEAHVANSQLQ